MAETTHLPLIGEVKKPYLWIGGIGLGVVVLTAFYRHQKNTSQAATDTTSAQDPNAIDPSTGMTYAEEASGASGSFPYGGVSSYGGSYYGTGNIVGYDQYGNPIYSTGITGNQTYTTNQEWATAAEDDAPTLGVDTTTAANAISRILAGLSVNTDQANLFAQLTGLLGQPPQGYPTPIKITDSPGQPGSGTGKVSVPGVIGENYGEAYNNLTRAGLKTSPAKGTVNSSLTVRGQSPSAGSKVNSGSTVTLTLNSSAPANTVKVPSVVGQEFGPAYNELVRAGFRVSPGKGGANATWHVTSQVPSGGSNARTGSMVTLKVSRAVH